MWSMIAQGNNEITFNEDEYVESLKSQLMNPDLYQTLAKLAEKFFDAMDADHDGRIQIEELTTAFRILGVETNPALWTFKAIDTDGDGVINKDEYVISWVAFFTNMDENHPSKLLMGPLI